MYLEPIIDYVSISVPIPLLLSQTAIHINEGTPFSVDRRVKRLVNLITSDHTAIETKRAGVFNRMIHSEKFGFTYMDGQHSSVSVVQISGQGCSYLRDKGWLQNVLQDWHDRLTRLDIAIDFKTDTLPEPFARSRSSKRFDNGGHERSDDGETWYVGRRTSARHARVYRYNAPHPRSDYLRLEYELHDKAAKDAGKAILEHSILEVARSLGAKFGWFHEAYTLDIDNTIKLPSLARVSQGKTERWVHKAVKPALEKLARSGKLQFLIDFRAWLDAIIDERLQFEEAPDGETTVLSHPELFRK